MYKVIDKLKEKIDDLREDHMESAVLSSVAAKLGFESELNAIATKRAIKQSHRFFLEDILKMITCEIANQNSATRSQ